MILKTRNQISWVKGILKYILGFIPLMRVFLLKGIDSRQFGLWVKSDFELPAPYAVKLATLKRYGAHNRAWIETGTYRGETTKNLSAISDYVITIEPSSELYLDAKDKFENYTNIDILNGTSEEKLEEAIRTLISRGESSVSFWLDGHYSAGNTHQGFVDSPIISELQTIEAHLDSFESVSILIDDVRCFNPQNPAFVDYPALSYLVDWALNLKLRWTIEFDIFIIVTDSNYNFFTKIES